MIPITEAVKHLLIINILMFLGTNTFMGDEQRLILALFSPESVFF